MRNLTKLCVLAASIAVSTSLAYADTLPLGVGSISLMGEDSYTSNSITFAGNYSVGPSYGSLSNFVSGDSVWFPSKANVAVGPKNSVFLFSVADSTAGSMYFGDSLDFFLNYVSTNDLASSPAGFVGTGTFEVVNPDGSVSYSSPNGWVNLSTQDSSGPDTTFSLSAGITPEPSSLLLLGTGLLAAAGLARRKIASQFV